MGPSPRIGHRAAGRQDIAAAGRRSPGGRAGAGGVGCQAHRGLFTGTEKADGHRIRSFKGQRIYVGGEVNQQREMELPVGMTVLQAVFNAGGFKETASPEDTILIRQGPNREPVPMRLDLKTAMYGQGEAANLALLPNNIVYVPKSSIAEANKFVNQYIEKLILFRGFSAGVTYQINEFNNN